MGRRASARRPSPSYDRASGEPDGGREPFGPSTAAYVLLPARVRPSAAGDRDPTRHRTARNRRPAVAPDVREARRRLPRECAAGGAVFGLGTTLFAAPVTATVLATGDERHAGSPPRQQRGCRVANLLRSQHCGSSQGSPCSSVAEREPVLHLVSPWILARSSSCRTAVHEHERREPGGSRSSKAGRLLRHGGAFG
jgi:hypothetical protein